MTTVRRCDPCHHASCKFFCHRDPVMLLTTIMDKEIHDEQATHAEDEWGGTCVLAGMPFKSQVVCCYCSYVNRSGSAASRTGA